MSHVALSGSKVSFENTSPSDAVAEGVIGDNRLGHEVRPLRYYAIIQMLAVIAERPAVEGAILHRCQIVRHEIAAEFIALIHHGP